MKKENIINIVEMQLGRKLKTEFSVSVKCCYGYPVVIENELFTKDGKFFPTIFWLSCPFILKQVNKLEGNKLIKELTNKFGFSWDEKAKEDYIQKIKLKTNLKREEIIKKVGNMKGIKCLHMHLAYYLATGYSEVGKYINDLIEESSKCPEYCKTLEEK